MIKKAFAIAIAAACMTSGAAYAQSHDYRNDRDGRADYDQRSNHNDRRDYRRDDHRGYDNRANDYRANVYRGNDYRSDAYRGSHYRDHDYRRDRQSMYDQRYRHSTHRPYHHMRRGERVAQYYGGGHYVVRDWNRHRGLYAPHRGHQWVQVGNDYALVAIATGIIAQVLLNN